MKRNRQLSSKIIIGVKSSVQSWAWKLFTAGSIITGLLIPSNNQVSKHTYFCYCLNVLNCNIVMVTLCILLLSLFNDDIIIMNILCNCYASYAYNIYILIPIDEADRTEVGYVCLWKGTSSGSKFLHLFNSCYHMVGRSSEVSLSRFSDIKM